MSIKYPELFQPFKIGRVEIKNRIVMSGMHNIGWKDSFEVIDERVVDYFEERAKGGVGLIITGANQPNYQYDNGVIMPNPFQHPGAFIARHKKLVDRAHSYGAKVLIQFGYGGGRVDFPAWIPGQGISASENRNRWDKSIVHRALTKNEIEGVINASIEAAIISKQTGCDGVDINCYGGYMMDQFLQPVFNRRDDEYGGLDGGIKIMADIVKGIKDACGPAFVVTCRIGLRQYIKGEGQSALPGEEFAEYGRTLEESLYVAKKMEEAGYDALYIGNGTYDSFYWLYPPMYQKEGLWLEDIAKLTAQAKIPVLGGGKILQPEMANNAVKNGMVDAIVVGRGLLADANWANKARLGLDEAIRPCIGCNLGCVGHIFSGLPQLCAVNADLFREVEYQIQPAKDPKKIAIIGGGIAGMECARIAAKRGHSVTLYEKDNRLGGTFVAAAIIKGKDAEQRLLAWLEREVESSGVKVELGRELSLEDIKALDVDDVVVATGNLPKIPPIPGLEQDNVVGSVDALLGKCKVSGNNIVVIGGGLVGCEVGLWLKEELGKSNVTLVEATPEIMGGGGAPAPLPNKLMITDLLAHHKVKVMCGTAVKRVEGNKVIVAADGKESSLEADTIILAIGFNSNNKLYREISANIPKMVWCLGDANIASNIMSGIRDANSVARAI